MRKHTKQSCSIAIFAVVLLLASRLIVHADDPVTVAVLDFRNTARSAEYDPLGVALREWLTTDLSNLRAMKLVERARISDLIKEMKLADAGFIDPSTAAKMGKGLGADAVLVGSFFVQSDSMRIDARLLDVESGQIIQAESIEGNTKEFFRLEKELAGKITGMFGIKLSSFEKMRLERVHTKDLDAALAYGKAQGYGEAGKLAKAKEYADIAVKKDSHFKLADELSKRITVLLDELKADDFEKKIWTAAALSWLLENAPVHRRHAGPAFRFDNWWPRSAFSDVEYRKIIEVEGPTAGLTYRVERIVAGSLEPQFALRNPPSWTVDHSADPLSAQFYPSGIQDLRAEEQQSPWLGVYPFRYAFESVINYTGYRGSADVFIELGMYDEYLSILEVFERSTVLNPEEHKRRTAEYEAAKKEARAKGRRLDPIVEAGTAEVLLAREKAFRESALVSRFQVYYSTMRFQEATELLKEYRRQFPDDTETVMKLAEVLKSVDDESVMSKLAAERQRERFLAAEARPRVAAAKDQIEKRYGDACEEARKASTNRKAAAQKIVRSAPDRKVWKKWFSDLDDAEFEELMSEEGEFEEHYWVGTSRRFYHAPGCSKLRLFSTPAWPNAHPIVIHSKEKAEKARVRACDYCLGGKSVPGVE